MVVYMIVHFKAGSMPASPDRGQETVRESPGRAGDGESHAERRLRSWLDFLLVHLLAMFFIPVM